MSLTPRPVSFMFGTQRLSVAIADDIIESRDCGDVRCGVSSRPMPSLAELAAEFGLAAHPGNYREVDRESAARLVELLLSSYLLCGPVMPVALAARLTHEFLAQFGTAGVRYFTNGLFDPAVGPPLEWSQACWNPVTAATFNAGVLVLGPLASGCLWVEDED